MLMNLENYPLKSQHVPTIANMMKTRDIHYQEDIVPLTQTLKLYTTFSIMIGAITPINEAKEQRKVNSRKGDDAKYNPREEDDEKSNPLPPICNHPDFDGIEPILMPKDQNATLLKGQHRPSLAKVTKMENLPYQEGTGPYIHVPLSTNPKTPPAIVTTKSLEQHSQSFSNQSDAALMTAIEVITSERLGDPGGTHSMATKHVFRDLGGTRHISFGRMGENNHLQIFGSTEEASQHRKWGCIPMLGGKTVPWINPREQDLLTRSMEAEKSTAGKNMDVQPARHIWEIFPQPSVINKLNLPRARHGLPTGFLYLQLGRIVATNFLNFLS